MGTRFFKLNKFKIDASSLKQNLKSTANYLGQIKENQIDPIFFGPNQEIAKFITSAIPYKIGMKNLNSTHYPSRYIYQIQYNMDFIENLAKGQIRGDNGNLANKIQDIVNQQNALIPYTFNVSREFNTNKEKLTIEEVTDKDGNTCSSSLFILKLITLPNENGYWFDTAEFTLSINSRS
jgi:hypothetical protein